MSKGNIFFKGENMRNCKDEYRTVRYMPAKIIKDHINNKTYDFDKSISEKIDHINNKSMIGVRLKINSPIFIEKIIEIGKDDLSELTKDLE